MWRTLLQGPEESSQYKADWLEIDEAIEFSRRKDTIYPCVQKVSISTIYQLISLMKAVNVETPARYSVNEEFYDRNKKEEAVIFHWSRLEKVTPFFMMRASLILTEDNHICLFNKDLISPCTAWHLFTPERGIHLDILRHLPNSKLNVVPKRYGRI